MWGLLQQQVYTRTIQTIEELRQRILEELELLDQRVIDSAVKQWRKPLHAYVTAKGDHFDYTL